MRFHRLASVTFTVALGTALVPALAYEAVPHETVSHTRVRSADAGSGGAGSDDPFGAACRIGADGSRVTAYCHNPYPDTDHVSLHIECLQWWDLDSDSAPVAAAPAQTVQLTGRCWKEVRAAWISHRKAD
ncbi:hypothetical protein JL475_15490 [Streptomyces sp. M2CJ-2]|uniref:hypothetical protein n=1 Tax=Streptomyces sp. M2CJ-2 TaxID=2803948 RepID=UPI001926C50E|nr:hypothetical protein [Streptomyces sp. M2CJ-2]MBL3667367.1 hypothetical protein [Streptomyces sp. M2CJ-2]